MKPNEKQFTTEHTEKDNFVTRDALRVTKSSVNSVVRFDNSSS